MNALFHLVAGSKALAWIHAATTAGAVAGAAYWSISMDERAIAPGETSVAAIRETRPAAVQQSEKEPEQRALVARDTVYVVDSVEVAAAVRSGFIEISAFRIHAGLPPSYDEVIVVGDGAEVAVFAAALSREAATLATTTGRQLIVIAVE